MNAILMKGVKTRLAGSIAIALLAVGVLGSGAASAGISNSKHNLGTTGNGANNQFNGTGEICVFCHTPHGASTTASAPLWNRAVAEASTYTTYNTLGTSSLDGATAPVGSVSLACLSCHDGATALNTMLNVPGSGSSSTSWTNGSWNTGSGSLSGGKFTSSSIANIGKDLQNDHPVGIEYGGGMTSTVAGGVLFTSGDIAATGFRDKEFTGLKGSTLNGMNVWWVETGTDGVRGKTDLPLYTRTGETSVANGSGGTSATLSGARGFVECATCHDPHTDEALFLRIKNTGSAVCLACHTK